MSVQPNYTENVPQMSGIGWKSDSSFTYSLLSGVYKQSKENLEELFPAYGELKVCKINEEDLFDVNYCGESPDPGDIIDDIYSPVVYTGVWLALGILFTITGLIWCICNKCCCCCTTRKGHEMDDLVNTDNPQEFVGLSGHKKDSKSKSICKILIAVLMALWIIGFSFSIFISFASNESLRKSIFELDDDVDNSLSDVETYLNITKSQIHATFITSYGNLSDKIISIAAPRTAIDNVDDIKKLLVATESLMSGIENHVDSTINFQVNGLTQALGNLKEVVANNVNPFFKEIDIKQNVLQSPINETIQAVGQQLESHATDLLNALHEMDGPLEEAREELNNAKDDYLDTVGTSIYGSFMAFNVVLLMILIGIVMGYAVTWIGKGNTKKTGFIFYRFSIVTMFIVGWIVLLAMLTQFLTAGFFSEIVCEAVKDLEKDKPNDTTVAHLPNSLLLLNSLKMQESNSTYELPTYSHIVRSCKKGESVYLALNLKTVYDVDTIRNISENFKSGLQSPARGNEQLFIKNAGAVYSSLEKQLISLQTFKDQMSKMSGDPQAKELQKLYSDVEFSTISVLKNIKDLQSGQSIPRQANEIIFQVDQYEEFVHKEVTEKIGQCHPLYNALNSTAHVACYKILAPVATYWWALQFLLCLFVCVIITALFTERIFN